MSRRLTGTCTTALRGLVKPDDADRETGTGGRPAPPLIDREIIRHI